VNPSNEASTVPSNLLYFVVRLTSEAVLTFISFVDPESFGHGLSAVFFKKRTETVYVKVPAPNNSVLVELAPSILYDFKVYSAGYEDLPFSLTSEGQGFTHPITVNVVKDLNGVVLYTHSSINTTQEPLITYSAGKALFVVIAACTCVSIRAIISVVVGAVYVVKASVTLVGI
jgi:hypothetical protein